MIKKIALLLSLFLALGACSTGSPSSQPADGGVSSDMGSDVSDADISSSVTGSPSSDAVGSASDAASSGGGIEVDKSLSDVTLTFPASLVGDEDMELDDEMRASGVKSVAKNADGSVTMVIAHAGYATILADMAAEVENGLNEMVSDGSYTSLKTVKYNGDFSEITFTVDGAAYESSFVDGMAGWGAGMLGALYQTFAGVAEADIAVTVTMVDETTGDVVASSVYPG